MKKSPRKPKPARSVASRLIGALTEVRDAAASSAPMESVLDVRSVRIINPSEYDAKAVRNLRHKIGVSQSVFAELLGVSPELVQNWEQSLSTPRPIARRLMDQIKADPDAYFTRLARPAPGQCVA